MTKGKNTFKLLLGFIFLLLISFKGYTQNDQVYKQTIKFQRLLALIDHFYVDDVDISKKTEKAIVSLLAELDPHSVYISKEEVIDMNEPLEGGFFGIGIQFNILRDTLMVVSTVSGGPSEKVGLRAGDRIVEINNEVVAGTGLKNSGVRERLKGDKGTLVEIKVKRIGIKELIDFRIIRDKIPIHSVDASYMLNDKTGYIKIARFAANTVEEFEQAVIKLKGQGMEDLVLDLTGNGGGFLGAAVSISDHLLDDKKLVVYTEGPSGERRNNFAEFKGFLETGRVVIMLDENSASASEIVSGAIQDWDRGVVVGRRSFGKGLVQRQFPLTDSSMIRLTTAHYYTPSGRCIQKPYEKGVNDYRLDILKRYASGELVNQDSINFVDSLKYKTRKLKRTVYGGGGIMPDIFVGMDTTKNFTYFNLLGRNNVIYPWVVDYMDKNRKSLKKKYPNFDVFNKEFIVTKKMLEEVVKEGEKVGVKRDDELYAEVIDDIKLHIKSLIARDLWDMTELYMIINTKDKILQKALKILNNGEYEEILKVK